MAKSVLQNVRLFVAGADLTTVNNQLELKPEVEDKMSTAFVPTGDVWVERLAGLRSVQASAEGQWEAGDLSKVDDVAWATLGSTTPWTACPATAAVGSLAYLFNSVGGSYELGDQVGEVAPWKAEGRGTSPLVRGQIAHPPGTARTASGTGTSAQLGAVSATQALYVGLHVHSVSGTTPSLTVRVESDNATGFPSPVTVGTFSAATAIGGQWMRIPGPITDDWFRAAWTISGTTPSFLFTVSFGIA
ncbi:hypothetical protein [Actinoplanes palleronii]|uniref:Minor tail protein n=1 Tax=Actinoplanes palleronii TaxID=113570 RepID=A0ABQ4B421_9ACTN|nr:hypothetical protein [Actinoplanes palleronii]GIE65405.1 hypothetical protein Apa02nite_015130 [Actinoplanes palleronii]